MDSCLSNQATLPSLGFIVPAMSKVQYRSMVTVATAGKSRYEPGNSFNAPLKPRTLQGRFLRGLLLNKRHLFHYAAADELRLLADNREAALARMSLSFGSDEASLHRRIAQLKERYCKLAVQEIMYMLIVYKYSEIRVSLSPNLSRCIHNGRLEIWAKKDRELESIHSCDDTLELIKEHVNAVIGLRVNSCLHEKTQIQKLHFKKVYVGSILCGYFLKSASLRHQLECSLPDLHGSVFGSSLTIGTAQVEHLRHYITGFDPETMQRCTKPRTEEARSLIKKQCLALFGTEESDETIVTSYSSLKRLVLEAVAFGTFLWDTELYVDGAYRLNENAEEQENRSL
ncbi:unnamed protein product [Eruca vesicaria subsp. sativa]|uniref:Uncharacterized protein n=1 Tax=Eruca vesicaria subsp. sativa TaxID=29727 RepID=A0ABC8KDB5_ERUVS|nr:unnamed protein product [Eruca vesicaria subsp. sativa]